RPPSALRRRGERVHAGGVRLSLPYRPPYDWDALFAALTARGDAVEGRRWSRMLTRDVDGAEGSVTVEPGEAGRVSVCVEADDLKALPGVLARVRRVFDLSADPEAIGRDLSADPALRPLVAARPGLRLPGDWIDDGPPDQVRDAPNDRLNDETLAVRAEAWRPWRAYGALHLALAGVSGADLMENDDARRAA
ncbi:MAG: AlkA N-terminal domain-containing protein, partial [Brevundimonas sp.]|nr:AlkA N-terminal domain-containing protein [Brevundimonas sp.]